MKRDTELRLTLEIEADRDPIAGWIEAAGGTRIPFLGMIELIALIDRVRGGDRGEDPGGGSGR